MTEAELLAAVVANLDDDGPRLVYADWLVERGDPRGELIQLQCAREEERARALYAEHRTTWEGAFRERARELGFKFVHLDWERGFPDAVYLRGASSAVPPLLELAPTARGLVFRHEHGELDLEHLLVRPWRGFGITGTIGDAGALRIAAALPASRAWRSRAPRSVVSDSGRSRGCRSRRCRSATTHGSGSSRRRCGA